MSRASDPDRSPSLADSVMDRAAAGELPSWARAGAERRAHMARVAELLDGWGSQAGLPDRERRRRRALGFLHDALREADPEELRPEVPLELRDLADPFLHGPAAAERLRREGVLDEDFLRAVAFHSLGHPGFEDLGRALYAADYLEPGRRFRPEWRAELRERFPGAPLGTVVEVARARIVRLVEEGWKLRTETVDFWNALREERLRGSA